MKTPFFSFAVGTTLSFLLLPQGAAAVRLLLMWQKYAIGSDPKSNLRSLFILCFLFHSSFQDDSPPEACSFSYPHSPDSLSSTFASQYIKLDGLISRSPSTGKLTEHKH